MDTNRKPYQVSGSRNHWTLTGPNIPDQHFANERRAEEIAKFLNIGYEAGAMAAMRAMSSDNPDAA